MSRAPSAATTPGRSSGSPSATGSARTPRSGRGRSRIPGPPSGRTRRRGRRSSTPATSATCTGSSASGSPRCSSEDDPRFANWDQDVTAVEDGYGEQEPATVAAELVEAAERSPSSTTPWGTRPPGSGRASAATAASSPSTRWGATTCTTSCTTSGTSAHRIVARSRAAPGHRSVTTMARSRSSGPPLGHLVLTVIFAMPTRRSGVTASVPNVSFSSGGGVRRDEDLGALEDGVGALHRQRLQRAAVQREEVGVLGHDLVVDLDVAVDTGDARVDVQVVELDHDVTGGQGQAGGVVVDLADDVRRDLARLEDGDVAARDREAQLAVVGELGVADEARGELERRESVGEALVQGDLGGAAGDRVERGDGLGGALAGAAESLESESSPQAASGTARRAVPRIAAIDAAGTKVACSW